MCQFNTSFLSVWQHSHHRYYILDTVQQDNLLVIFGEFVCNTLVYTSHPNCASTVYKMLMQFQLQV